MTDWDKRGYVLLAESVDTHGEDPPQGLEFQRQDIFFLGTNPPELKERQFNLTIHNGDHDLTFSGLSARKICEIAEDMIRLVGGTFRVEPPPPPEIKF
jgi:hypothetical protein